MDGCKAKLFGNLGYRQFVLSQQPFGFLQFKRIDIAEYGYAVCVFKVFAKTCFVCAEDKAYVYFEGNQVLTDGVFAMKDNASQVDVIALPQTLPAGAKIKIEYTINAPGSTTPAIEQVNIVEIDGLSTTEWLPGKRYIYNMTFSFDEIYFAPEILDWVNAGDTEIKIDDYQ